MHRHRGTTRPRAGTRASRPCEPDKGVPARPSPFANPEGHVIAKRCGAAAKKWVLCYIVSTAPWAEEGAATKAGRTANEGESGREDKYGNTAGREVRRHSGRCVTTSAPCPLPCLPALFPHNAIALVPRSRRPCPRALATEAEPCTRARRGA